MCIDGVQQTTSQEIIILQQQIEILVHLTENQVGIYGLPN